MNIMNELKNGVLLDNPVFMQTIGLCPALATTTSLSNAIGMGFAATVILIASNIVISALRKFIPDKVRIAAFITVIAAFVTIVDLSLQAFIPALAASLGLFLPLIVVNCIILGRAEAYASKNQVLPPALDGLCMGLGFTFALVLTSGEEARTLPLSLSYFTAQFSFNYTAMFAAVTIAVVPSIVIFAVFQEQVVSSLTAGSVKE